MTSRIASVTGRQLWDSRGRPTVEAEVSLESGVIGRAIAPAGASRGAHEAIDLRDGGEAFGGHGETVRTTAEFMPAFERARASGKPAILHCFLDPQAITPARTLDQIAAGN